MQVRYQAALRSEPDRRELTDWGARDGDAGLEHGKSRRESTRASPPNDRTLAIMLLRPPEFLIASIAAATMLASTAARLAAQDPAPSLTLPAFTGYAHPDPEA